MFTLFILGGGVCLGLVVCFLFFCFFGGGMGGGRVFFSDCKTKADYIKNIKKSSETSVTASFLKQDPNT